MSKSIGLPNQISGFVFQTICIDIEEQEVNAKLMPWTIAFPNQISGFVFQTKCMQDMDEQEANAKLVLGTIAFPYQMKDFFTKPNACRTWMSRRQTRSWSWGLSTSCWVWGSYPCASTSCRRRSSHRCQSSYSFQTSS
jgi:hypothetical protein